MPGNWLRLSSGVTNPWELSCHIRSPIPNHLSSTVRYVIELPANRRVYLLSPHTHTHVLETSSLICKFNIKWNTGKKNPKTENQKQIIQLNNTISKSKSFHATKNTHTQPGKCMSSVLINEYPVNSHSTSKVLTVIEEMPENTTDSCRYSWYKLCRVCLSQAGMSCNLRHLQIYKVHIHTYICVRYIIFYIYIFAYS